VLDDSERATAEQCLPTAPPYRRRRHRRPGDGHADSDADRHRDGHVHDDADGHCHSSPPGSCANPGTIPAGGGTVSGSTAGGTDDVASMCTRRGRAGDRLHLDAGHDRLGALRPAAARPTIRPSSRAATTAAAATRSAGPIADCTGSRLFRYVTAGQQYAIIVDGLNGASGNFTLTVTAPGTDVRPISGKKLLIKDNADHTKRKIIFLSKDPNIIANGNGDGSGVDPSSFGADLQHRQFRTGRDASASGSELGMCRAMNAFTLFKYGRHTQWSLQDRAGEERQAAEGRSPAKVKPIDYCSTSRAVARRRPLHQRHDHLLRRLRRPHQEGLAPIRRSPAARAVRQGRRRRSLPDAAVCLP
jgi:hypothetical protein